MTQHKGYFGIGVFHPKREINIGTLFRSATCFGAAFVFTVGRRYKAQASDTCVTWKSIPLYHYLTIEELISHLPKSCPLVGVEILDTAVPLPEFKHPDRACYILGAEDHGLNRSAVLQCHKLVSIPGASNCLNVASAASIIMYDRATRH